MERASPSLSQASARAFGELLAEAPQVDASYCPISQAWAWLAAAAGEAVTRLIAERDATVLEEWALALLRRVGLAKRRVVGLDDIKSNLAGLVKGWGDLNRSLFWHEVAASRLPRAETATRSVTHFADVWPSTGFWCFGEADFEYFVDQLSAR